MSNTKKLASGSSLVNANQDNCGLVKVKKNSPGSAVIIFLLFDKFMHYISRVNFINTFCFK